MYYICCVKYSLNPSIMKTTVKISVICTVVNMFLIAIALAALLWLSISTAILRFTCPKMTETELLLNVPRAFIGDWDCGCPTPETIIIPDTVTATVWYFRPSITITGTELRYHHDSGFKKIDIKPFTPIR